LGSENGCTSLSRKDNQISQSSSSFEMGSDIVPPQLTANCVRSIFLPWADRWPPCRACRLVAPNPIEQIGGGIGSPVAFSQPVGDFMGDGGRVTPAVAADRKT
jgi:hypothetical protein